MAFVNKGSKNICEVDHFLPHLNKQAHTAEEANINGVWNLVLADPKINSDKSARVPHRRYLERHSKKWLRKQGRIAGKEKKQPPDNQ